MIAKRKSAPLWALLLGGMLAASSLAQAQNAAAPSQAVLDQRMARVQERLRLTADQEARVRVIQGSHIQGMSVLLGRLKQQDSRRGRGEVLRQMQGLRQDTNRRMAAVLSPRQMAAYEAFIAEQEARMRTHLMGTAGAGDRPLLR